MENFADTTAFTYWVYNRYVWSVKYPNFHHDRASEADRWCQAMQQHIQFNLQRKGLHYARRAAVQRLNEMRAHQKNRAMHLEFMGEEASKLTEECRRAWEAVYRKWEEAESERLGKAAEFTETKALRLVAQMIRMIDRFAMMEVGQLDEAYLCGAANNLMRIITNNGYEVNPDPQSKQILIKYKS